MSTYCGVSKPLFPAPKPAFQNTCFPDRLSDTDVVAEWEEEIQNRIMAVDSGEVIGISYREVMLEAEKRLSP